MTLRKDAMHKSRSVHPTQRTAQLVDIVMWTCCCCRGRARHSIISIANVGQGGEFVRSCLQKVAGALSALIRGGVVGFDSLLRTFGSRVRAVSRWHPVCDDR